MKKGIGFLVLLAVIGSGIYFLSGNNWHEFGADHYYVQVNDEWNEEETKLPDGEVIVRYEYNLRAYDAKGNEATEPFTSSHPLREGAYLKLFIKDGKGVTSYREVAESDVPKKALEKM